MVRVVVVEAEAESVEVHVAVLPVRPVVKVRRPLTVVETQGEPAGDWAPVLELDAWRRAS